VAAALGIRKHKRVLIVDADPQCNATQALFTDDIVESLYTKSSSFTIQSVIQPLSLGKGYAEQIRPLASASFGVDVIPGDPRLALKEDLLASDWNDAIAGKARGLRTSFMFVQLLELCTRYDFVLFDVGPSLGSINRAVLVGSDYFISPMSSDIFSLKAIENITKAMSTWQEDLRAGLRRNPDKAEVPQLKNGWNIMFAGYVMQQYFAKKDSAGEVRAVTAYERIMKRIPKSIDTHFVKRLQPNAPRINYNLGTVPNLFSLIPMSQTSRKPIFQLRGADGVVGAHFTKVREAGELFEEIATRFMDNLSALSDD
jgi:cellulose biosynthesis protein BcsQ